MTAAPTQLQQLRAAYQALDRHLRDDHHVDIPPVGGQTRAHLDRTHQQAHAREATPWHPEAHPTADTEDTMVATHQLHTSLKTLALSGMLDTLEARLAQAHAGDLGHLDFLQALCQDEIARREAAALQRRLRAARFEATTTIEDFDFAYNPKIPAARIRDLATLRFLDLGQSVVLHGPVGVGKSHIAQALGHAACRRGHTVAFTKTSRLLADLAGGHADRSWETRLRRWARPALLILDDFAMRQFTVTQADDLYELISERTTRSLIITANRAAEDWYQLFPNPVVAESILDRVVNTAHHIHMPGRSYRSNHRPTHKATP